MSHNNQSGGEDEGASKALEKIMGTITVGLIFRHFVSGAVFVAAYYFALDRGQVVENLTTALEKHSTGLAITSLLAGTLIYTLHRSITNPAIEVLRHGIVKRATKDENQEKPDNVSRLRSFLMPKSVEKLMFDRWEAGEQYHPTPAHISSWGDYVHLQYTVTIAMILGPLAAYLLDSNRIGWHWNGLIFWTAVIFFLSGLYTDCRKHIVELESYTKQKSKRPVAAGDGGKTEAARKDMPKAAAK